MSEELDRLAVLARKVKDAEIALSIAQGERASAVTGALLAGEPVGKIASAARLSRERVYQIRDHRR